MLLEHVKNVSGQDEEVAAEILELTENINKILEDLQMTEPGSNRTTPEPGMADDAISRLDYFPDEDDVQTTMDTIMQQMNAAKKAMGMLNQMADSPFRTKNKSRVLGNLNKIRGSLRRVEKMLEN